MRRLVVMGCLLSIVAVVAPSGAGAADATCDGKPVTLFAPPGGDRYEGTSGPDVILGTPGPDVIAGLGGNDTICGLGGDDLLLGGPGDDFLAGQVGNDTLASSTGLADKGNVTWKEMFEERFTARGGNNRRCGEQSWEA